MIDILIPTYNRAPFLIKNILLLNEQMETNDITNNYRILVSNNCSTDNTIVELNKVKAEIKVELKIYEQSQNIGLEKNAIFLLCESNSDYIIYLGDDDYLPSGYLKFVVDTINSDSGVSTIIPGFSELYADGTILPARSANFDIKKYYSGINSAIALSNFGHQLSGLLLKRSGLSESYLKEDSLRNIYPFIFFVAFNNIRGTSYYTPKFQVLVSQGNSKDWRYDDSGLLIDILKNFKILYPDSKIKKFLVSWSFASKQSWRLRVGFNLFLALKAFIHLIKSNEVDILFKASLIFLYPYCYFIKVPRIAKKVTSLSWNNSKFN